MAKRFTATEKWDDPFFFELEPRYKLFWIYLLDKCNHAGIWDMNKRMAEFCVGEKIDWDKVIEIFDGRIKVSNKGKWFIPKFIYFQYGVLNPENRAHASVISILKSEGLYKGLISSLNGAKDKDKDKDKDMDKDKTLKKFFEILWERYPRKEGKKEAMRHFNASVKTEEDCQNIEKALDNYVLHLKSNGTDSQFIKMGSTWFNNWEDYINWKEPDDPSNTIDLSKMGY